MFESWNLATTMAMALWLLTMSSQETTVAQELPLLPPPDGFPIQNQAARIVPREPKPVEKSIAEARRNQINLLTKAVAMSHIQFATDQREIDRTIELQHSLLHASLDSTKDGEERIKIFQQHLGAAERMQERQDVHLETGTARSDEVAAVRTLVARIKLGHLEERDRQKNNVAQETIFTAYDSYAQAAREWISLLEERYETGSARPFHLLRVISELADTDARFASDSEKRLAARREQLDRTESIHKYTSIRLKKGTGRADEEALARAAHAEAQIKYFEELSAQNRELGGKSILQSRQNRLDALRRRVEVLTIRFRGGSDNIAFMVQAEFALADAEMEYATNDAERMKACKRQLSAAQVAHEYQAERARAGGRAVGIDLALAKADLASAEVRFLEEAEKQNRK